MKNSIKSKIIDFSLLLMLSCSFLFALTTQTEKAKAADCVPYADTLSVTVAANHDTGGSPKAFPGEPISVTITNTLATNDTPLIKDRANYNLFFYPVGTPDTYDAHKPFFIVSGQLTAGQSKLETINTSGKTAGNWEVRVSGFHVGVSGTNDCSVTTRLINPIVIAETKGVVITPDNPEVTVGDSQQFTIKFYDVRNDDAGSTNTFTIYSDKAATGTLAIEETNISLPPEGVPYYYTLDTTGVTAGKEIELQIKVYSGTTPDHNKTTTKIKVVAAPSVGGPAPDSGESGPLTWESLNKNLNDFFVGEGCDKDSLTGVMCFIRNVINYLLDLVGVIAFIMVLYASILYLTSYGEESKAELAKKTLTWSFIGLIVFGASKAIFLIIVNILKNKTP